MEQSRMEVVNNIQARHLSGNIYILRSALHDRVRAEQRKVLWLTISWDLVGQ